MDITEEIDAIGLLCPLPVLKLRKRLMGQGAGDIVALLADDPAAVIDVPHFCNEQGHDLLEIKEGAIGNVFLVKKGAHS